MKWGTQVVKVNRWWAVPPLAYLVYQAHLFQAEALPNLHSASTKLEVAEPWLVLGPVVCIALGTYCTNRVWVGRSSLWTVFGLIGPLRTLSYLVGVLIHPGSPGSGVSRLIESQVPFLIGLLWVVILGRHQPASTAPTVTTAEAENDVQHLRH